MPMQLFSTKKYLKSFSFWWLVIVCSMALLAPIISNNIPLIVSWSDQSKNTGAKQLDATEYRNEYLNNTAAFKTIVFAAVPYAAGKTDADNLTLKSPFDKNYFVANDGSEKELPLRFHHFMGTDKRGCDVLAGIIYGARYSLFIAFISILITALIALFMGIISGYFAFEGVHVKRIYFYFFIAGLFFAWFYGFYVRLFSDLDVLTNSTLQFGVSFFLNTTVFFIVISLFHFMGSYFSNKFSSKKITIPIDAIISRITETITSIPAIILIISIVASAKPSATTIILIFGFTMWTDVSRIVRAEVLKLKSTSFIEAAIASGLTTSQIIFRHMLTNIFPVILPILLYGIAQVILTEAGLSFLGLGVAPGTVTWGNLLVQGKENIEAWWLIVFTGMFIFLTVNSLYKLGKKII